MSKETFATPWKEFAERFKKYYRPPGGPSDEAIKTYRKHLQQATQGIKNPKVLLFGATPRLRDLCFEEGYEVTLIDMSMEMILAMSELMKKENDKEIRIQGDWVGYPFEENYFDVAMGDLVVTNVPNDKRDVFLKQITRTLKPGGHFVSKMYIVPQNIVFGDYESVLDRFKEASVDFYLDRESMAMEFVIDLINRTFKPETKNYNMSLIKNNLSKYFDKDKFVHPDEKINSLLNIVWDFWKPMDKTWSSSFEPEVTKEIAQYFDIKEKTILSDCFFQSNNETIPIWDMKNKK